MLLSCSVLLLRFFRDFLEGPDDGRDEWGMVAAGKTVVGASRSFSSLRMNLIR
jgi:hypothetical protein